MNWLNIQISTFRAPQYIGSEPASRATWINVLAYCCEQENGGRIKNCSNWKDRQWQQVCGVTIAEINAAFPLLTWDGDDLTVWNYPKNKQQEVQAKRKAGKSFGRKSVGTLDKLTDSSAICSANSSALSSASGEHERKGMEGERKEKGREEKGTSKSRKGSAQISDDEWLAMLCEQDCYQGIDVRHELGRMNNWCVVNDAKPSRRRFINWLNRIDRPMSVAQTDVPKPTLVHPLWESFCRAGGESAGLISKHTGAIKPWSQRGPHEAEFKTFVREQEATA